MKNINKKLLINAEDEAFADVNGASALDRISVKSKSLKATLKAKYLLYKLEKSFFNKKFIL
jgi:hypothetical protein